MGEEGGYGWGGKGWGKGGDKGRREESWVGGGEEMEGKEGGREG